jgi:uncharacterized protein (TIGR02147 family)
MTNPVTEHLFEYDNYRFFLRDYFVQQKKLRNIFSHRYFARRAGFSSSSFCAHVIDGKRNLTDDSLRKIIKGLGITGRLATYFETLVRFNQAKTVEEREQFIRKLERLRKTTDFYKVNEKQVRYFEEWYYPVIRELAVYSGWNGDYHKLAALVRPSITPEKARKAVEILVEMGLLICGVDGSYSQSNLVVSADDLPPPVTRKTRRELIYRAIEAMESLPVDRRHISGCTVAVTGRQYTDIVEQIDELRKRILESAMDSSGADRIYQVNFQVFPLSAEFEKSKPASNMGEKP